MFAIVRHLIKPAARYPKINVFTTSNISRNFATNQCSKINFLTGSNIGRHLATSQCYRGKESSTDVDVVDVDLDSDGMMYEDNDNVPPTPPDAELEVGPKAVSEAVSDAEAETEAEAPASTNLSPITVAPIDINPWIDEELDKDGTVDMEYIEKLNEEIHYPEINEHRSGSYEFEGISIWLPPKMLSPSTYRYRLDKAEQESLPDDIRICRFEQFKPNSKT